ncbi:MAG: LTA synthase family protein, partial [Firmicutes bacterium]|nr:LTA synthase family protein [Bacillota bacterium]
MSFTVLPISIFYLEVFNAIASNLTGKVYNFAGALFMSIALGLVLNAVISLFPKRAQKWVLFIFLEVLTVFTLIEHFTDGAYSAFMSPAAVIEGAGGVATGFGDIVEEIIRSNIPRIIIAHIPVLIVLFANIFIKKKFCIKRGRMPIIALLVAAVFFGSLSAECCMNAQEESYTYGYNYDNAVRSFGIANASYLDSLYKYTGVPEAPKYEVVPEVVVTPTMKVYEANAMDIDFDALLAGTSNSTYKNMLNYVSSLEPSLQNEMTGIFKGKNLILICGETFCKELINEDINPTIYKLANEGIVFDDFYQPAWGGSTSSGEASILMGVIVTEGVKSIQKAIGKDNSYTIPSRFRSLSDYYKTYALHDGDQLFYNRPNTHPALGFEEYLACGKGMKITINLWPRSDLEMMQFTGPLYLGLDHFCVYYMTVSGHCRYNWAGNAMSKKHKEYIQEMLPDASMPVQAYYACNYDLELAMEDLMQQLEDTGRIDDTVIVMTGDHYPYALVQGSTYDNPEDYLGELYGYPAKRIDQRDHNGLIIWSKELAGMEEKIHITEPTYTPDILPTLL